MCHVLYVFCIVFHYCYKWNLFLLHQAAMIVEHKESLTLFCSLMTSDSLPKTDGQRKHGDVISHHIRMLFYLWPVLCAKKTKPCKQQNGPGKCRQRLLKRFGGLRASSNCRRRFPIEGLLSLFCDFGLTTVRACFLKQT